eukprot:1123093-Prymnesium_polylepis.1
MVQSSHLGSSPLVASCGAANVAALSTFFFFNLLVCSSRFCQHPTHRDDHSRGDTFAPAFTRDVLVRFCQTGSHVPSLLRQEPGGRWPMMWPMADDVARG